MIESRSSGILLHPTSLPGRFGIGDLGKEAYRFVNWLAGAGQSYWQILPLGPTAYGDSPYQCYSAFAGNPLLIDLDSLVEEGYLSPSDLDSLPDFPPEKVDYGEVIQCKLPLLRKAAENFQTQTEGEEREQYDQFCQEKGWWLDDYTLFASLKNTFEGRSWTRWDKEIVRREPETLDCWRAHLEEDILARKFWQYQFFKQWLALKQHCEMNGIQIIGDIPIYIAHDSVDVWANPHLFHLKPNGDPEVVSGVPPDYFSKDGQLWGNPIYRWDILRDTGFQWWCARFQETLKLIDIARLDHFRGFEAYWEVPAGEKTARNGRWVPGPGSDFFHTLKWNLGNLPVIAEDLGLITPQVEALRDEFDLPGMSILQFAFGSGPANTYLPHNHPKNHVAYLGTHDNDTIMGWWNAGAGASTRTQAHVKKEKDYARRYLNFEDCDQWTFIRALLASPANTAIIPLQDIFGLGNEARMNLPGRSEGNWQWRYTSDMLTDESCDRLLELTEIYGRGKEVEEEEE